MTLRTQSRRASLAESLANIVVGLWIQMAACLGAFKFLGVQMSWTQFTTFTIFMTAVSVVRSYCLRRLWNAEWWKRKKHEPKINPAPGPQQKFFQDPTRFEHYPGQHW